MVQGCHAIFNCTSLGSYKNTWSRCFLVHIYLEQGVNTMHACAAADSKLQARGTKTVSCCRFSFTNEEELEHLLWKRHLLGPFGTGSSLFRVSVPLSNALQAFKIMKLRSTFVQDMERDSRGSFGHYMEAQKYSDF